MSLRNRAITKVQTIALVVIILVAVVAGLYYISTPPPTPIRGGTLIVGTTDANIGRLNPYGGKGNWGFNLVYFVYDTLVGYEPNSTKIVGSLATDWERIDDLAWDFHIRKSVKFRDGTILDARAVAGSLNSTVFSKLWNSYLLAGYVSCAEVIDDYVVRIHLNKPCSFLPILLTQSVGAIYSPTVAEEYGADFGLVPESVVGTGPWIFDHWIVGQEIVFRANKNHWDPKWIPMVDTLIINFFKDEISLLMAFEAGEVDIAYRFVPLADIPRLTEDPNIRYMRRFDPRLTFLSFNMKQEYVSDINIRYAIGYALDYDGICNLRQGERRYNMYSALFKELYPGLYPEAQLFLHQNITKAKEYLAKAGYPNGLPETIDFYLTPVMYGLDEVLMASMIQSNLKQIGIKLELRLVESGLYWAGFGTRPMWISHCSTTSYLDPQMVADFILHPKGGAYPVYSGYSDFEYVDGVEVQWVADMLNMAAAETDMDKRIAIFKEVQDKMDPLLINIWLYQGYNYVFWRENVHDVYIGPNADLKSIVFHTAWKE